MVELLADGLEAIEGPWWLIGAVAVVGLVRFGRPLAKSGIMGYLATRDCLARFTSGAAEDMRSLYQEAVADYQRTGALDAVGRAGREIPRDQWARFFDDLSRRFEGRPVTIEAYQSDTGAQDEVLELPLVGISADRKGTRAGTIEVIVGTRPDDHLTHTISAPTRVRIQEGPGGAPAALEIGSASGPAALVRFSAAAQPRQARRRRQASAAGAEEVQRPPGMPPAAQPA